MILITGANGHLGKKLIAALAGTPVRALVRSDSARQDLQRFVDLQKLNPVEIVQLDTCERPRHKIEEIERKHDCQFGILRSCRGQTQT